MRLRHIAVGGILFVIGPAFGQSTPANDRLFPANAAFPNSIPLEKYNKRLSKSGVNLEWHQRAPFSGLIGSDGSGLRFSNNISSLIGRGSNQAYGGSISGGGVTVERFGEGTLILNGKPIPTIRITSSGLGYFGGGTPVLDGILKPYVSPASAGTLSSFNSMYQISHIDGQNYPTYTYKGPVAHVSSGATRASFRGSFSLVTLAPDPLLENVVVLSPNSVVGSSQSEMWAGSSSDSWDLRLTGESSAPSGGVLVVNAPSGSFIDPANDGSIAPADSGSGTIDLSTAPPASPILATPAPEPGAIGALTLLGGAMLMRHRRQKRSGACNKSL